MKRITVFYGNYGSGKTEIAINCALSLCHEHTDVTLVDLDIVNPYFRSSEHAGMLKARGIRVISPVFANTAVDLPTLPADIYSAFLGGYAVFDCGGDPVGAAALGSLKEHFDDVRGDTEVFFVINTRRPFQESVEHLEKSLAQIQHSARLRADGFVLNTNLGPETTGEELVEGYGIAQALADRTGVPIAYVSGTQAALNLFQKRCPLCKGKLMRIEVMMRPYWM